jgi:hypothetical protein
VATKLLFVALFGSVMLLLGFALLRALVRTIG